jgi:hypothetical protein
MQHYRNVGDGGRYIGSDIIAGQTNSAGCRVRGPPPLSVCHLKGN